jgi:hypothetical protein
LVALAPGRGVKGDEMNERAERVGSLRALCRWLGQWVRVKGGVVLEFPDGTLTLGSPPRPVRRPRSQKGKAFS